MIIQISKIESNSLKSLLLDGMDKTKDDKEWDLFNKVYRQIDSNNSDTCVICNDRKGDHVPICQSCFDTSMGT